MCSKAKWLFFFPFLFNQAQQNQQNPCELYLIDIVWNHKYLQLHHLQLFSRCFSGPRLHFGTAGVLSLTPAKRGLTDLLCPGGLFFSPPSCCSHLDWGLYGWIYLKITEETNIYFFFPLLLVLVHLLSVLIYAKCVEIFNWIFLVLYTDIARKIIAVQIGVFLEPLCSLLMLFPNACVGK